MQQQEWQLIYSKVDPLTKERGSIEPTEAFKHDKYKVMACSSPAFLEYSTEFWFERAKEVYPDITNCKWLSPEHHLHDRAPTGAAILAIYTK